MSPPLEEILLVEDDPDIQEIALLALETVGGFRVRTCSSGREAVAAAERGAPDLVLLDYMMPEMDGAQTLAALRRLPPMTAVPVVFLTAKVQADEVSRFKALGAVGVIAKPFDPMTLPDQVRAIWEQAHG